MSKTAQNLETVTIRFAGDSGDGMQLTGTQFTQTTAMVGNDLATFPDFPAEIRAPAGSLAGVSGFQLNFSSQEIYTHGDAPDVLVAMNPAALRVNIADLKTGGILICNSHAFTDKNLERAGLDTNPLEDGSLSDYRLFSIDITTMTLNAIADVGLNQRAATRSKNFFALGLVYWLFNRPMEHTSEWIEAKFGERNPDVAQANLQALKAGYYYGETAEAFTHSYVVDAAPIRPGRYRNITGNEALGLGLLAAGELSGLQLFLGSYPITPASDVLHFLARHKNLGVKTFQAEDEIAAVCVSIGAAFAGGLAVTTTSGPGLALKGEAIGLAAILELPLIVCNIQRGGPSTGLPTKTEQSDLLQSLYGRNGECPLPIVACATPGDCFDTAIEAARISLRHMIPVLLLSDGFLANGAEPWPVPKMADIPRIPVEFRTDPEGFLPYKRDENLSRPWAIPGTPGLEHRVGGLEKEHETGNVCYDPDNHQFMTDMRAAKVAKIADFIPPTEIFGDDSGDVLVIGWGGTYGSIHAAVTNLRREGRSVSQVHLRHLNPFPNDLGDILGRFRRVLVPELNMGQLASVIRARYVLDVQSFCKVQGKPFMVAELMGAISSLLQEAAA